MLQPQQPVPESCAKLNSSTGVVVKWCFKVAIGFYTLCFKRQFEIIAEFDPEKRIWSALDKAKQFGMNSMMINNDFVMNFDDKGLSAIRKRADDLSLSIILASYGVYPYTTTDFSATLNLDLWESFIKRAVSLECIGVTAGCGWHNRGAQAYRNAHLLRSVEDARKLVAQHTAILKQAEKICRKYKMHFSIENHTEWTADELVQIMKNVNSEYIGVTLDSGNFLYMAEDPIEATKKLAPYARATHLKDTRIECHNGRFFLRCVPFGHGHVPLPEIVDILKKTKPEYWGTAPFTIEMIPAQYDELGYLEDEFWNSFEHPESHSLMKMLKLMRDKQETGWEPRGRWDLFTSTMLQYVESFLPIFNKEITRIEDEDFGDCLKYAREILKLQ